MTPVLKHELSKPQEGAKKLGKSEGLQEKETAKQSPPELDLPRQLPFDEEVRRMFPSCQEDW